MPLIKFTNYKLVKLLGYFIQKLKNIGIKDSDQEEEKRRLVLSNVLALTTCIPPVMYGIVFAYVGLYKLVWLNILFALLFLITLPLNWYQKRYIARVSLITTLCLAIFSYSLILGLSSGIYLVSFAIICIGLVLFPNNEITGKIISAGIPFGTILLIFFLAFIGKIQSAIIFQPYLLGLLFLSISTTTGIIFSALRFFIVLNESHVTYLPETHNDE